MPIATTTGSRSTIDGLDKIRQFGAVDDVDGNVALHRLGRDDLFQCLVGNVDDGGAIEMARDEALGLPGDAAGIAQIGKFAGNLRRDDIDRDFGLEQEAHLAQRLFAGADNNGPAALQIDE